jgi:4-hydroxybenzoate polyprenyltransferase
MLQDVKGFAQFISVERGLMLFLISIGATFLTAQTLAWPAAIFLGVLMFCIWSAVDAINNVCDVDLDRLSDPHRANFTKKLGRVGLLIVGVFVVASLLMGAATMMPYVVLFVAMGIGLASCTPYHHSASEKRLQTHRQLHRRRRPRPNNRRILRRLHPKRPCAGSAYRRHNSR